MVVKFEIKGHEVLVDEVDADLLELTWSPKQDKSTFYVIRSTRTPRATLRLHRVIMSRVLGRDLERHEMVDHEDRNGLNNARSNLRLATNGQNQANRSVSKHNKLGIKGVSRNKNKYHAEIRHNKQRVYLGSFSTPEEAHAAYVEAAKKYFGEFARGE